MCGICGCGEPRPALHDHDAAHDHEHPHVDAVRRVEVERSLLAENEAHAARLRARLAARGIEAIGLLGGPGAGKTALLEATFARLGAAARDEAVVEGDCATDLDARRIAACGVRVAQVATGSLCHLDAAPRRARARGARPARRRAALWSRTSATSSAPLPSRAASRGARSSSRRPRATTSRQVPGRHRGSRRPRRDEAAISCPTCPSTSGAASRTRAP